MKTNNKSESCTHNGVRIEINYWDGNNEIRVSHNASDNGYDVTRQDRYDLEGNRITDVEKYFAPFTEEYFTTVDAKVKAFANCLNAAQA